MIRGLFRFLFATLRLFVRTLDFVVRGLFYAMLIFSVGVLVAFFFRPAPEIPEGAALLLRPTGSLVAIEDRLRSRAAENLIPERAPSDAGLDRRRNIVAILARDVGADAAGGAGDQGVAGAGRSSSQVLASRNASMIAVHHRQREVGALSLRA